MDKAASLTPLVKKILLEQATEPPFSTTFCENFSGRGTYLCRLCGLGLFKGSHQFTSGCGWPSFDEDLLNHVQERPDADGHRTEIICSRCEGHLGHVFRGELFTKNNIRYCVNGSSLDFINHPDILDTEEVIVAGGCFWGIEHLFKTLPGVLLTEVGYIGGLTNNPSYQEVCRGDTQHLEAVRVIYDPKVVNLESIYQYFFEIHDPSQVHGQGPDIGYQYQSAIFYYNNAQKETASTCIKILENKGYDIATQLLPMQPFWPAELAHQNYYEKHQKQPYCHRYTKRF